MHAVTASDEITPQSPTFNISEKEVLQQFENQLDPCRPESGVMPATVVACGEVSAVLTLKALPDQVCKRMSGFETESQVHSYIKLVKRYCQTLESIGVDVVPTRFASVKAPVGGFTVYLTQPALPGTELGNDILKNGKDEALFSVIAGFLENAEKIFSFNHTNPDKILIAADSQISNWHVTKDTIRLLDVGTPCIRKGTTDLFDSTIIGKAMPLPLRFIFNRLGMFQRYFDSYFCPREIIVDHLANYIKEGRPDRIPITLDFIHSWIEENGHHLKLKRKITIKEIKSFYQKDVVLLEAFLQCRRLDRFIRTGVMKKTYNYILPGKISRF